MTSIFLFSVSSIFPLCVRSSRYLETTYTEDARHFARQVSSPSHLTPRLSIVDGLVPSVSITAEHENTDSEVHFLSFFFFFEQQQQMQNITRFPILLSFFSYSFSFAAGDANHAGAGQDRPALLPAGHQQCLGRRSVTP
jgi:hypothetical protein